MLQLTIEQIVVIAHLQAVDIAAKKITYWDSTRMTPPSSFYDNIR